MKEMCIRDRFKGVFDRQRSRIIAFTANNGQHEVDATEVDLADESLKGMLGERLYQNLADDVELLDGAGYDFDMDAVRHGRLSPVFFGSARCV